MAISLPQPETEFSRVTVSGAQTPLEGGSGSVGGDRLVEVGAGLIAVRPVSALKRVLDVVASLILLCVVAPLLGVLALLIVIDSRGGPFFSQTRVGRGGREFRFLKLRTMVSDAEARLVSLAALNEAQPPLFKIRKDPRITRIGGFLRRSSLDELPQLWNVLRGDMSLVGPRPPLPSEVATYTPEQARRLSVLPGMTGLWQVSGRSEIAFDDAITLDLTYIDSWSLALDVRLLVKTLLVVVRPRGAY